MIEIQNGNLQHIFKYELTKSNLADSQIKKYIDKSQVNEKCDTLLSDTNHHPKLWQSWWLKISDH